MTPDLAQAIAAGATVVTPNRRLALSLKREFDDSQAAAGRLAWESADIQAWPHFVTRFHDDALHSDAALGLPLLLSPAQEQQLWEEIVGASAWADALLSMAQTAAQCREAWQLAHEWRIAGAIGTWDGNEDTQAFAAWSRAYARRCERAGSIDAARLPDAVSELLERGALRRPKLLIAYAFDVPTPQQRDFLATCRRAGVEVQIHEPARRPARSRRLAFAAARDELESAAQWARARLEANAASRIGIVVPDLEQRRQEVSSIFLHTLSPGWSLPAAATHTPPFNISLGLALVEYPLVHAALVVLDLAQGEIDFALASRLIRSPFLGGARSEAMQRARLDAVLRRRAPSRLTLAKLLGLIKTAGACPVLAQRLADLYAQAQHSLAGSRPPQDWARRFSALLEAVGFPGERALDSTEFQTREKLHEVLAELARLGRIAEKITFNQSVNKLRRLCTDTLFQPESTAAPIQVLGIFEAAGLGFDHLWVSGLSDEAWPLAVKPNPFIPLALQKKAGVPQATPESSLERDRRLTAGWLAAADEVIVSHPLREKDRDLVMSPLIAAVPPAQWPALNVSGIRAYRDMIHRARALEPVADDTAPAVAATAVRGGARVLVDQAACPFRAFARHRLGARAMEAPAPGLDAADRGTLMHVLLKAIWDELKDSATLASIAPARLEEVIAKAANAAIAEVDRKRPGVLEGRFARLERERLARLAREWLEVERRRPGFEVIASEQARSLKVADLTLEGRIDRMDRLADGGHALIDYKTGKTSVSAWLGGRPDDPQLPLYAREAGEDVGAVAFAKVGVGDMRFDGLARQKDALPGAVTLDASRVRLARHYASWDELRAGWQRELEALARGFAAGEARVDPKYRFQTCELCDLQSLCRVHERFATMPLVEGEEAE